MSAQEQRNWKDWGVSPKGAKHVRGSHSECAHCGKYHMDPEGALVGFSSQVLEEDPGEFLYSSVNHRAALGVWVRKCSNCGGLSWGHADKFIVEGLLFVAKEDVGGLKPEIRKQLLKAWEEDDED